MPAAIAGPQAGDLLGALAVTRVADHFGGVFEDCLGQPVQHFGVGDVIDHTVKRPAMGVEFSLNTRHADAPALEPWVSQRLGHAFAPGIFHRPKLRHPVIALSTLTL
jgi:hypothetical protein